VERVREVRIKRGKQPALSHGVEPAFLLNAKIAVSQRPARGSSQADFPKLRLPLNAVGVRLHHANVERLDPESEGSSAGLNYPTVRLLRQFPKYD